MKDNKHSTFHITSIVFADDGFGNLVSCPASAMEFNWDEMYGWYDIYFNLV